MTHGTVIRYCERKQWGFIRAHAGEEIFFHRANCDFQPRLGAEVEYEIGKPFTLGKSPQAVDVRESQPVPVEGVGSGVQS